MIHGFTLLDCSHRLISGAVPLVEYAQRVKVHTIYSNSTASAGTLKSICTKTSSRDPSKVFKLAMSPPTRACPALFPGAIS